MHNLCKLTLSLVCLVATLGCGTTQIDSPSSITATSASWKDKTLHDLDFIRSALAENHPGFYSKKQKPEQEFLSWYDRGFVLAKTRAEQVKDVFGYYFTLRAYGVGFNDEHLAVQVDSIERFKTIMKFQWPGFAVRLMADGDLRVVHLDTTKTPGLLPSMGAKLESCDGRSTKQLLRENVFPFYGNEKILKNRQLFGPRIFVDSGNPFIELPKKCKFSFEGKSLAFDIAWSPIDFGKLWPLIDSSTNVLERAAGTHRVEPDMHWVRLPTFAPSKDTEKIYERLIASAKDHLRHKAIVFDVRGNTGGSSAWGSAILRAYFGQTTIDQIRKKQNLASQETYEYRVSKHNWAYFKTILGDKSRNIKKDDPFFNRVVREMELALQSVKPLIQIKLSDFDPQEDAPPQELFAGKIYVLTDMLCFSACLSFIDTIKLIPNVIHIGQSTSADSVFMQTTDGLSLSDQMVKFSFPVLRILNRPRGHNEPIHPKITYNGDLLDQSAIESWVAKLNGSSQ